MWSTIGLIDTVVVFATELVGGSSMMILGCASFVWWTADRILGIESLERQYNGIVVTVYAFAGVSWELGACA
jgi:hypothetical protein